MTDSIITFKNLQENLSKIILGQDHLIERLLIVLLADGHLLVEGAPGLAKTRAIKTLGEMIEGDFHRIQFTPDLLPADVTGTEIYRPQQGIFHFQKGPVFHNLILADEINRAPAKVQSALLEAMAENQVTIGGETYNLPRLFLVMATQNPIEQEGTYPLPEAQLDRFLLNVLIDYPSIENELNIMRLVREEKLNLSESDFSKKNNNNEKIKKKSDLKKISEENIFTARNEVLRIYMSSEVEKYLVEIIAATRSPENYSEELARLLTWGASPRASLSFDRCARARSWIRERDFVTPEDIQDLALDVLRHRIILSYEAESEGISKEQVINKILEIVSVT
tara:strand:+ start:608 stop:1618 length:1011 start_codon:yes stop_codon:yes gene_type:complete